MKLASLVIAGGVAMVAFPITMVAETHRFTPTVYYPTYSFAHPPALRIKPGDRVITKTIDAGGSDENGRKSRRSDRIRRSVRSISKERSPAMRWS